MKWRHWFVAFVALAPVKSTIAGQAAPSAPSQQQLLLQNYEEQVANLKLIIADKDQKIASLQQQLNLTQQDCSLLEKIVAQNEQIATIQKQSIADRDSVIQQLAQGTRESTVKRLVESIPSIAGIIAIALK